MEIKVPDIGDFKNVEIIEILVEEGQTIEKNDALITLESDKSSVEVPSSFAGTIKKLNVKIGDKVSQGDVIGELYNLSQTEIQKPKIDKKEVVLSSAAMSKSNGNAAPRNRIEIKQKEFYGTNPDIGDIDPEETDEWIESLNSVVKRDGADRAHFLLSKLINQAYVAGSNLPFTQNTPYINTIPLSLIHI